MIKAIIIEDEPYIRKGLIAQIKKIESTIEIVAECATVKESITAVRSCKPDLVFLDINLPDGTGFDFLRQTTELNYKVIFITAYDQYALKALKNGAIDYILKPIDIDELAVGITKVLNLRQADVKQQIQISQEHFNGDKNRLILSLQEGFQVIIFEDLIYCKSDKGYTTFYLVDGRSFMASKSIKHFEFQLPSNQFIRTHQSYIVNLKFIDRLDKDRLIHLHNKVKIPLSVRKKEEFTSKMLR